jgi:hypothetical protein
MIDCTFYDDTFWGHNNIHIVLFEPISALHRFHYVCQFLSFVCDIISPISHIGSCEGECKTGHYCRVMNSIHTQVVQYLVPWYLVPYQYQQVPAGHSSTRCEHILPFFYCSRLILLILPAKEP